MVASLQTGLLAGLNSWLPGRLCRFAGRYDLAGDTPPGQFAKQSGVKGSVDQKGNHLTGYIASPSASEKVVFELAVNHFALSK